MAYGYTYTSLRNFFSPVFHTPDDIPVSYNVKVAWWQTGTKTSNTTSRLNVGLTSSTDRTVDAQMNLAEASETWKGGVESKATLSHSTSSLTKDKNRVGVYVDNKTWKNSLTQHYVVLNYFHIEYR